MQIPTPDETNDNIVAYWVPDKPPPAQQPLAFAYRMRWQMQAEVRPPTAWVVQSRRGRGIARVADGHIKFVVDFDGPALRLLPADADIEADVSVGTNAELAERNLFKNRVTGLVAHDRAREAHRSQQAGRRCAHAAAAPEPKRTQRNLELPARTRVEKP